MSAINTELRKPRKENKQYKIDLLSKVKDEVGKYAHRYGTHTSTTVNNWKRKFSNPQKEVGESPEKLSKRGRPLLAGEELLVKIKEAIIEKTNRSCDFSENGNFNW